MFSECYLLLLNLLSCCFPSVLRLSVNITFHPFDCLYISLVVLCTCGGCLYHHVVLHNLYQFVRFFCINFE